jgi:uncharacterized membrane protein
MRFRNSPDLLLIIAVTLAALLFGLVSMTSPIMRAVFALPLVFIFPGYSLVSALLPNHIDSAIHLLLALALSIAITGAVGLALHFTEWGLNPQSWLLCLSSMTLVASIVALARRGHEPPLRLGIRLSAVHAALFGLAAVFVVFAIIVARDGAAQQVYPGFTQLWLAPVDDNPQAEIQLGVRNEEAQPMTYRLVVNLGETQVQEWDSIKLAAGEQWEVRFALAPEPNSSETVNAQLYRLDEPDEVYRSVSLVISQ